MPRHVALLFVSILCVAAAPPPEVPSDTTAAWLWNDAKAYHGRLVRINGVVEHAHEQGPREEIGHRYDLTLEGDVDRCIHGGGRPPAAKGDRVRITGRFTYKENSFVRYRLAVIRVEKFPAKKRGGRSSTYSGCLS